MRNFNLKRIVLLIGLLMPAVWLGAYDTCSMDGYSNILIKEGNIQGAPKGNAIHASINGHMLVVVFSENLGQVAVEVTTASGGTVQTFNTPTPNGMQLYIPFTGNYIVTFTLPNGDMYYGEFTVTD